MVFWAEKNNHLILFITVIPKASKDEISALREDALGQQRLVVRLRAVPEKGKANKALIGFIAKKMHIAKSDLTLILGETSRQKTIKIDKHLEEVIEALQNLYKKLKMKEA